MSKCVLFARVSTQGQDYEHQLRQLRPVAIANGYSDSDIITVEGKESAISLEEEQRETLNEMKEIIEQYPDVNHVFVAAIDRLARRVSIVLNVADFLASRKVNLTFLAPMQMTLLNPDGTRNQGTDMNLMLLAYGAQQEMSIKKARFQSGKAQLKAQKKVASGTVLYGYRKGKDKRPQVHEEEASIIREVFSLLAGDGDWTATKVDRYMVEKGEWKTACEKYHSARVCTIVHNPAYKGGESAGVLYPRIVSDEVWEKAGARLRGNRNKPKVHHKHRYYGDCGLTRYSDGRLMSPCAKDWCYTTAYPRASVSINIVDLIVKLTMEHYLYLMRQREGKEQLEQARNTIQSNLDTISNLNTELSEIDKRWSNLSKAYILFGDTPDIQKQRERLTVQKKSITARITELQETNSQLEAFTSRYGEDDALKDAYRGAEFGTADFDTKKQLIKQVIKHVTVHRIHSKEYSITVELTDAASGLVDDVIGLEWHYTSHGAYQRLWCGDMEVSCKGAIAMLKQQRDNAPIPDLPEPPEWAS